VRYLDADLRDLLSGLWVFHSPFHPDTAVSIFEPDTEYPEGQQSPVYDHLNTLYLRGLLAREIHTMKEGTFIFYRLLPAVRLYAETMSQAMDKENLLSRFGLACAGLARLLAEQHGRGTLTARWLPLLETDLQRGLQHVEGAAKAKYLNELAIVDDATGQPMKALQLYEAALPITREVGDRQGEATILNNMADIYRTTGQPVQALALFEQALLNWREVGDRASEAATLNGMAIVYRATGQLVQALALYEQALPIAQEEGNRAVEATTLHNMAGVYATTGQSMKALELYDMALPIRREVGDRHGEATTLNNMAYTYHERGEVQLAIDIRRQIIQIYVEIGSIAEEVGSRYNLAVGLQSVNRIDEAIDQVTQSIASLKRYNLPQDAGGATLAEHEQLLAELQDGGAPSAAPSTLKPEIRQAIIVNTVAVMTTAKERHSDWQQRITSILEEAKEKGDDWRIEVEYYTAVLAILDGKEPMLPDGNPYAGDLKQIQTGIDAGGLSATLSTMPVETRQAIIGNTIAVMTNIKEKYTDWRERITGLLEDAKEKGDDWQIEVEYYKAVLALLDGKAFTLPDGNPYADDLKQIQAGIAAGGLPATSSTMPMEQRQLVINKTLAVMTAAKENHNSWYEQMSGALEQAKQGGESHQIEFEYFTAVLALLDGKEPVLPDSNPYADDLKQIQTGIQQNTDDNEENE
jgi:tetratricopeptide (TPR) repeat protein